MSVGLILEGGGNRGAYTAGVLDVLAENDIYIQDTYAVSAGACNAMSYLSKQPGRNYHIYTEYANDKRYSSWKLLWKTGSLFGFDFIFGELAHTLLPALLCGCISDPLMSVQENPFFLAMKRCALMICVP